MTFPRKKKGKQGHWKNAIGIFLAPIVILFSFRWIMYEPFVIPSESMTPGLLVHDHIIVNKHSYGIKMPLGDGWLIKFKPPQRGDVVVFRYPQNRDVFFIKRLIGLPGDKIKIQNGQIIVNEKPWALNPISEGVFNDEDDFSYFTEIIPEDQAGEARHHLIKLFYNQEHADSKETEVAIPDGQYFVMGDNRDQSHDSRFWGMVSEKYLVGKASYIWLSCDETLLTAPMICDPLKLRGERIFKKVGGVF